MSTDDVGSEVYAKLPHDEWYGDYQWQYILDEESHAGAKDFDPAKVAEVVNWHVDEGSYGPEHSAVALFRMDDGTFVVYSGWCDTTGWDCQSDARFTYHPTQEDAIRFGLEDQHREWFGYPNPTAGA